MQMTKDAYTYPTRLAQTIAHLPLEDSLDVYAAASQQEKKDIRRAVASKIAPYYSLVEKGKKSSADYKAVQPRIQKFFQDKP
jgi:hypothetical protein